MANDRNDDFRSDYARDRGHGREYGSGRDGSYSRERDDRNFRGGGTGYGERDDRPNNQGGRETFQGQDYYGGRSQPGYSQSSYGQQSFGQGHGNRFADPDRQTTARDHRGEGRQPQGYDYQDRGFMARAGDEVRSWFGDDDAERRREYDQRNDERLGNDSSFGRDTDYSSWRKQQIDALDRDYRDYRQENARKFESEFASWRANRQTQRQWLGNATEHMEIVGSDGAHVGTVDKVSGDRIILTKSDADAGGRHHMIPCGWIQSVSDKVTITKSADDAKAHWRDEDAKGAMFGSDDKDRSDEGPIDLNRSFSGTY